MSFSAEVKAEICRHNVTKKCCARAEAYGVLLHCTTFSQREIRIITANNDFATRLPRLFNKAFSLSFDSINHGKTGARHSFLIEDKAKIQTIFRSFGMETSEVLNLHINLAVLENDCCRLSFVRGAYLASGSMTDPEKRCHLELSTTHSAVGREMYALLLEMGFESKQTKRGGSYVTYFKKTDTIEEIFTVLGATAAAARLMAAKIDKDMRNDINRKINCDSANIDKTVEASSLQLEAIRRVEREIGLGSLPEDLQQAALLRIANPEASLAELAMLSDPAITKSTLSHRLRKIAKLKA